MAAPRAGFLRERASPGAKLGEKEKRMRAERVAVLGGGVAGLSAAQELAERGFEVSVYEARSSLGGKAKSQWVSGSGRDGRRDLPGGHGFRFFPALHRHVIETMRRLPFG